MESCIWVSVPRAKGVAVFCVGIFSIPEVFSFGILSLIYKYEILNISTLDLHLTTKHI